MAFDFDNKTKTTLILYSFINAIILILKPKIIFNDNMDLKILVLTKDKKYSIPVLYVAVILVAIVAYYIPRA